MASGIRSFFLTSSRRRSQAGFTIIEALIFVPMIFLMTFLTLEVTNILRVYETLSWTGEYAVRLASEGMRPDGRRLNSDEVWTIIKDKLSHDLPVGANHIEFSDVFCAAYYDELPSDFEFTEEDHCMNEVGDELNFQPGDFVSVRVKLHYKPMLSETLFSWMFPDGELTMSTTFERVISAMPQAPVGRGRSE